MFVNDRTLGSPTLEHDDGTGFRDTGAPPLSGMGWPLHFLTPLGKPGSRYRVTGRLSGNKVESNVVTHGNHQLGIDVTEPAGGTFGQPPNPSPAPARIAWTGGSGKSYFLFLRTPKAEAEWCVAVGSRSYSWGDASAETYNSGPSPLTPGERYLTVCEVDASGWVVATSNRPGTAGNTASLPFTFEVQ